MKMRSIELGDDEMPESVTVTIGWDELALIVSVFGELSPGAVTDVLGPPWTEAFEGVCRGREVFNSFHDAGVDDVLPRQKNLMLRLAETQARLSEGRHA